MREDYKAARKLGEDAVRSAVRNGTSPYLPVLDLLEEVKHNVGQNRLGLLELPISRIKGNKEAARNNAFANNFMPLFGEETEFALKWSNLYDSYQQEGIRDAIKVYEYMNQYYVQEGNKRVSVSKFGGTEYILADVIRIKPQLNDSKEVKVYYEYLDFYEVTKNFLIVFSELGEYAKLAELLGQDLKNPWPEDLCADLKSAFYRFSKNFKNLLKIDNEFQISDAFLLYISIFPMKTILEETDDQITKNMKLAQNELRSGARLDDVAYLSAAPEEVEKPGSIMSLFSRTKKYTPSNPLKVGFIYDADIETSRWIDSHEAGRLYVDEMTDDNVVTNAYFSESASDIKETIKKAVSDKNEIIFTVSPNMLQDTLKSAVHNPEIKFLNCSVGQNYSSLRCYQGKLYEASFLMGILAANTLLTDGVAGNNRKIGYVARKGTDKGIINLNAFAIGVSLIDPSCKISLKYVSDNSDTSFRKEWEDEGIKMFADIEYSTGFRAMTRPGVYKIVDGRDIYIGAPFFNWGKYYVQIVQSVLSGTWNVNELLSKRSAANYWFGLSTGVVDIRAPKITYQTKKLLAFFKNSIVNGDDPFEGEIHAQDGMIVQQGARKNNLLSEKMSTDKIVSMDWLCDNIEGDIPVYDR